MIKDKTITKTGWEILMEKLGNDLEKIENQLKRLTPPDEMDRDEYSDDEGFYEDRDHYYRLNSNKNYVRHLIGFVKNGGVE